MYTLIELPSRVNDRAMPEVSVVDMREELRKENRTEFSTELLEKSKIELPKRTNGFNAKSPWLLLLCDVP